MIVVIVRKDHCIDGRKSLEVNSRRHPSSRTGELYRGSALTPYRIDQYVESAELNKEARMTYPRNSEHVRCATRNHVFRSRSLEYPRIGIWQPWFSSSLDE